MRSLNTFFLLLVFLLLFQTKGKAQRISPQDSLRIEGIIREARSHVDNDPDKALATIDKAVKLSEARLYHAGLAASYNVLGTIYNRKSENRKAIQYYNLARKQAMEASHEGLLSSILYNSATAYERLGDYDNAFIITQEALQVKRRLHDSLGIARCYRQIAQYLSHRGDYKNSISYFDKALVILRRIHADPSIAKVLGSKAVILTDSGAYGEARDALYEALQIDARTGDSLNMASNYLNLGFCYDGMQRNDSAEHYYLRALEICRIMAIEEDKVTLLNNLGELYLQQNRLKEAEPLLLEALESAAEINDLVDQRFIQANLAQLYYRKGDYKRAYHLKEDFIRSSDSLMNEEKMKALEELSIRFETKETEERNKLLEKENDLQRSRLQQRNYLVIGIVLFALFSIALVFLYARQRRFRLQREKLDIEQKLLQIQMNPHFIFNSLQAIQGFILTNRQKESAGYLTSFSRLMRLILDNSRHDFISLDKELDTLKYYLELQQLRFKGVFSYGIHVDPSIDQEFRLVPPMLLQPFIENSIEHGFTGMKEEGLLKLDVSVAGEQLVFEVSDNGIGIEASKRAQQQAGKHRSLALEIIRKRIGVINQSLGIAISLEIEDLAARGEGERGTRVRVIIPAIHQSN